MSTQTFVGRSVAETDIIKDEQRTPVPLAKIAPSFLEPLSSLAHGNGQWILNPTFQVTRSFVGRSFTGTESVSGEPLFAWGIKHFPGTTIKEQEDLVRFIMSITVATEIRKGGIVFARVQNQAAAEMIDSRSNRTNDLPLASLVIIREYDTQKEKKWWTKTIDAIYETIYAIRFVITDGIPTILTDRKFKRQAKIITLVKDDATKAMKANHASIMPRNKHWYIATVGTDPDMHGTGQGSAIMQRIVQLADQANVDSYLEANGPNKRFYEKFGYVVQKSFVVKNLWNPEDGDSMTTYYMTRRCQQSG